MKGRKPKSLQRQMIEGDTRKIGVNKLDDRLAALPKATRGIPDPPPHLQGLAREQWLIWREDLELMEQDYRADAAMLEGACVNYARAVEADELLKDGCECEEPVLDRATGAQTFTRIKNHPAVARSNLCWKNVHMFCSELGLSLISRQRLAVEVTDRTGADLESRMSQPRPQKPEPSVQ